MKRPALLVGVLFALLVGAAAAWWFTTFERTTAEIDMPLRGEARYNPLYALQRSLQRMDVDVRSRARLSLPAMKLRPDDAVVLASDVRILSGEQADELLEWVEHGGRLVVALPPDEQGRPGELLEMLGVTVRKHHDCVQWRADGSDDAGNWCTNRRFAADDAADFDGLWGDEDDGWIYGRRPLGDGTVTLVADFRFAAARALDDDANAALAWQVFGPAIAGARDRGRVHIVYAADVPPAYVLLVRHGWPVLLPLLAALLLWLWARSQRFGPLLPPASQHRRALLEHVQAAGEFAVRRGRGAALYPALRRQYIERLRLRDPQLAALDGPALIDALARDTGLSAAELRQALQPHDLRHPDAFTATIKTLMKLRALP